MVRRNANKIRKEDLSSAVKLVAKMKKECPKKSVETILKELKIDVPVRSMNRYYNKFKKDGSLPNPAGPRGPKTKVPQDVELAFCIKCHENMSSKAKAAIFKKCWEKREDKSIEWPFEGDEPTTGYYQKAMIRQRDNIAALRPSIVSFSSSSNVDQQFEHSISKSLVNCAPRQAQSLGQSDSEENDCNDPASLSSSQSDCGSDSDLPANIDQHAVSRRKTNKIALNSKSLKIFDAENELIHPHQTDFGASAVKPEEFIKCLQCGQKQEICEQNDEIIPRGFTCSFCLLKKGEERTELRVKDVLPQNTELAHNLEKQVNNFLAAQNSDAAQVRIQVLSSSDKSCQVLPEMKKRYGENFPDSFPYTQKVIRAFQETDKGVVLFFCMYVQEYGSECPEPNRNKAYISYLDTVQFLEPGNLRTSVYHIILNGQAEDAEKRGVEQIHVWPCPPGEGVDYIFNKHPPRQRVLPQKKLEEWYKKRFPGLKNFWDEIKEGKISSPTQLPYFDGHGFPILMEDILSKDKEIKSGGSRSKRQKLQPSNDEQLWLKIVSAVRKEKFLFLDLNPTQEAEIVQPIKEPPEPVLYSGMMDDREGFLGFCIDRNLQFSSLPEARFATLVILREESAFKKLES